MKHLIKIIIGLMIFTLIGFTVIMPHEEIPQSEQAVNRLLGKIASYLQKKYNMCPIATNVAMPRGVVKLLGLDFQIKGPLSKEELRKILINSVQDFLLFVNNNEDIQPYLENIPFEIKNINIIIFIVDSKGYGIENPHISNVDIRDDILEYQYIERTDIPRIKRREKESIDEALKLLQNQS